MSNALVWFAVYTPCHCSEARQVRDQVPEKCPEHDHGLIEPPQLVPAEQWTHIDRHMCDDDPFWTEGATA